jgi:ATP-binding cassette subfamily G (WHITE) protein 2 (SNQ2)
MPDISVEQCLTMCGLTAFADAAVGSLGVEQRKRTTIAIELAAKVRSYAMCAIGSFF